jgi:hypothetical protein
MANIEDRLAFYLKVAASAVKGRSQGGRCLGAQGFWLCTSFTNFLSTRCVAVWAA